ncbi:hypothetical protein CMUS01_11990 [Colletotrichum musicola]|uniref:Bacteriophage T5 Orf172 DNA-binding domain-containing protein n=1 Tax=Colletotrichum musicola TaxID=2175873 RepID=A0A8H6JRI2_9PEZI|nr:hypothetical protein CMUS01_11990 [Colletotrichum musicola]
MGLSTPRKKLTSGIPESNIRDDESMMGHSPRGVAGLGWVGRNITPRDSAKLFKEASKPLAGNELKTGLLYVLEHMYLGGGYFKIGWTEADKAETRLKHGGNCNKYKTRVIYETEGFLGAFRAEKLVHGALGHRQLQVYKCDTCPKQHREWFMAKKRDVIETVVAMEMFVTRSYDRRGKLTETGKSWLTFASNLAELVQDMKKSGEEVDEESGEELYEESEEPDEDSDEELEELDEESDEESEESDAESIIETPTRVSSRRKSGTLVQVRRITYLSDSD